MKTKNAIVFFAVVQPRPFGKPFRLSGMNVWSLPSDQTLAEENGN